MKLFLVSPQDEYGERVKGLLDEHFGNRHIALGNRGSPLWIVAATIDKTPAGIAEMLNMAGEDGEAANLGVVVQIHDYSGYDTGALWQQMDVWSNE